MASHDYAAIIDTPVGKLGICCTSDAVSAIEYLDTRVVSRRPSSPLARQAVRQLHSYFRNPKHVFDLPTAPSGTRFQRRIWRALQRIPAGETKTYGQLAAQIDSGPRAVGNACRANPLSILVPCHRVVAASGLGGYSGARTGAKIKRKRCLLQHERAL